MNDTEKEFVLADLTAFAASGPTILFIRSQRELTPDEERNIASFIGHFRWPPGVTCVGLPHDMDVFAIGEAEMKKLGLQRIPT